MPDIDLTSTDGGLVNLARMPGRVVVFIYPYTGRPDHSDPPGWDDIPGAHGSTPQALAFSAAYDNFLKLDVRLYGLSFQGSDWQKEFVDRKKLNFALLSDAEQIFAKALKLETFAAGEQYFLRRRALVIEHGRVTHDFYPVPNPPQNAADVLGVLVT